MSCSAKDITKALKKKATKARAEASLWFFKTGPGEYGEGDIFIGVTVPDQHAIAKQFQDLPVSEIAVLLASKVHEHRLTALYILIYQFKKADYKQQKKLIALYTKNFNRVNNWDLVDSSAGALLGTWLLDKDRSVLYRYAKSKHLWTRRIAIVATFAFIRANDFKDTLTIAELLLNDRHDLMHKAVGWMLREVGKRDADVLRNFLYTHMSTMPRTTLRYAIEKFTPAERRWYLKKN